MVRALSFLPPKNKAFWITMRAEASLRWVNWYGRQMSPAA
jgi:hypothetical protein